MAALGSAVAPIDYSDPSLVAKFYKLLSAGLWATPRIARNQLVASRGIILAFALPGAAAADFMVDDESDGPPTVALWLVKGLLIAPDVARLSPMLLKEMTMKRIGWAMLGGGIGLLAAQQASAGGLGSFSDQSFRGSYALGISGTVLAAGPVAGTGVITSDGQGNVDGVQTISYGSGPCVLTFAGTYSVNPDGTGTGSVTVTSTIGGALCTSGNGSTVEFSFVLSGKGLADRIKLSETSPGFAILAEGDRQ
jgi:hypothetical protein